jgi:serine/threonine protein kinase
VSAFGHGWLDENRYFFDMEICTLNLDDYIYGGLKSVYGIEKFFDPDSHIKDELGCLSFLGIIGQITNGLQFIHSNGELHRDLKPRNSNRRGIAALIVVLLSARTATWKIADFGLTSEGTSGRAYTTRLSRGTDCYRGPELIGEVSDNVVSMKSDIWALGCIIYELILDKKAFRNDVQVFLFASDTSRLEFPVLPEDVDVRCRSVVNLLWRSMLVKDWWKRPSSGEILQCLQTFSESTALVYFSPKRRHARLMWSEQMRTTDRRWRSVLWARCWYRSLIPRLTPSKPYLQMVGRSVRRFLL